MKVKVITSRRFNQLEDYAIKQADMMYTKYSAESEYDRIMSAGLRGLSLDITRENLDLLVECGYVVRAIHYYSERRIKDSGDTYYRRQYRCIPLTSVRRKRNVIYIVESRGYHEITT